MGGYFLTVMLIFVFVTLKVGADSVCRKTTSVCEVCEDILNTTQSSCCKCAFPFTELNNRCFFTVRASLTHQSAQQRCASIGATLGSIRNSTENELIRAYSTMGTACTPSATNNCLIILGLQNSGGILSWENGDAVTYTNFANNQSGECTGMLVDVQGAQQGQWKSISCQDTVSMALCERKPDCAEE
ncbi:lectin c-type domain-containing protein [Ditylenchus destructor]|uniref:Lectin c-type domain-containing protein n=1 Tax=Ditylenchus destructor TaxID=166010 RepID=A0AAD4R4I7_9BILA|nr:lectin c-type domain-containing protein [Ditylenchus destructor]